MDGGAWQAAIHAKSQTQLNDMTITSRGQKLRHWGGICFPSPALAGENFTDIFFFLMSLTFVLQIFHLFKCA